MLRLVPVYTEERVKFFVDSGAGQSMSACSEAFHTLRDCAILVVGVAGSMPAALGEIERRYYRYILPFLL